MKEPTLEQDEAIEIHRVQNGYLVKLPHLVTHGQYQPIAQSLVFESFGSLTEWLAKHFTHRNGSVRSDLA